MTTQTVVQRGMRIGELAAATSLSPDTIRYYEKAGLLPDPARTPAGYRAYGPEAVDRVFRLTKLDEELQQSDLWANEKIRRGILNDALPKLLIDKIGLDTIIERVPNAYLRSIFGSYLASRFVYEFGSSPSQFAFYDL